MTDGLKNHFIRGAGDASSRGTYTPWVVGVGGWRVGDLYFVGFNFRLSSARVRPSTRPPTQHGPVVNTVPRLAAASGGMLRGGGGVEIIFYFRSVNEQRDIILLLLWVHCRAVYYLFRGRL